MKQIILFLLLIALISGCEDKFLDLNPLDEVTEAAYFKTPDHFKAASMNFYKQMLGWRNNDEVTMDWGTDISANTEPDYGKGNVTVPGSNTEWWDEKYSNLRDVNILLAKAAEYEGEGDISEYVAIAKFFRAYWHFILLDRFGGVPIVTEVPDVNSEVLNAPRNSRYEVFQQIYDDLKAAMPDLRTEQQIGSNEKGTISKWAAEAFLAKILLFEATWEMHVGTTTDGDGTTEGAGSAKPTGYLSTSAMIQEANTLAKDVMDNGGYELWDKNDDPLMDNWSSCYLFNLEDAGSNPGGYEKSSNNEFILYTKFDFALYQGNAQLSHSAPSRGAGNRKFLDMFLCSDGLPIDKSEVFQGYSGASDEYKNRDYRLSSYFARSLTWAPPLDGEVNLSGSLVTMYENRKFRSYMYGTYRATKQESFDYPQIRIAEIYFIYFETLYYLNNGVITDAQLDATLNKTRARAGLPPLTDQFIGANGLDLWEEYMRERTVELFQENSSRYSDLKRFAIAEEELGKTIHGAVIEGTEFENNPDLYQPDSWSFGEESIVVGTGETRRCLVIEQASTRNFARKHYLWPLPSDQINLNGNLLQNPGY